MTLRDPIIHAKHQVNTVFFMQSYFVSIVEIYKRKYYFHIFTILVLFVICIFFTFDQHLLYKLQLRQEFNCSFLLCLRLGSPLAEERPPCWWRWHIRPPTETPVNPRQEEWTPSGTGSLSHDHSWRCILQRLRNYGISSSTSHTMAWGSLVRVTQWREVVWFWWWKKNCECIFVFEN